MRPRAVSGYTAEQVEDAMNAVDGEAAFRFRCLCYDSSGNLIGPVTGFVDDEGSIKNNVNQKVPMTGDIRIKEKNIDLPVYPTLIVNDDPVAYFKVGEMTGATVAVDSSGKGHDGAYTGGITFEVGSLLPGAKDNTAIRPNGSTGYIDIASGGWMNFLGEFSLELWASGESVSKALIYRDNGTTRMFGLEVDADGLVSFTLTFTSGSPATKTFLAPVRVNDGIEHHIVATYSKSLGFVIIYIDGIIVLSVAETRTLNTGALNIRIGAKNNDTAFTDWTLDEITIWGRALTYLEVRHHFQRGSNNLSEVLYERKDKLQIWLDIRMPEESPETGDFWAEVPIGFFEISSPQRDGDEFRINRPVALSDFCSRLLKATTTARYTIPAETNYIDAVLQAVADANVGLDTSQWSITTTDLELPSGQDYEIDTPFLDIINGLLFSANYELLRFDPFGRGILKPFVLAEDREPEYTYHADGSKIVYPEIKISVEISEVKNQVNLSTVDPNRDEPVIISKKQVTNINNPVNVFNIPPNVLTVPKGNRFPKPPDQGTSDDVAKRIATDNAQIFTTYGWPTGLNPFHGHRDVIAISHETAEVNMGLAPTKVVETEWQIPINPTGRMQHSFQRVETIE